MVQQIVNARAVHQAIISSQTLRLAYRLVPQNILQTQRSTNVFYVMFPALHALENPTLNALVVNQGTFCNLHQQFASLPVQRQVITAIPLPTPATVTTIFNLQLFIC